MDRNPGATTPSSHFPGADRAHAPMPDFVTQRVTRFYQERYEATWGGKLIFHGRTPEATDVVLQSNDYLSIANHPDMARAITAACQPGHDVPLMSAALLLPGSPMHVMEDVLARFLGYDEGVLAQSGYLANVGLLESVVESDTPVYIDILAHKSLWDGVRNVGAPCFHFAHNDTDALRELIALHGVGVVVVDSVYSSNGSLCDLQQCALAAEEGGCLLIVDESHSLGTHGVHGEGLVASLGLQNKVHFVTASLSKAYACRAGFIACPKSMNLYIRSTSSPAIFSSTLLPTDVAAIEAAHQLVISGDARRTRLWSITRYLRDALSALGYPVGIGSEQIISFEIGTEPAVMRLRDVLENDGIFGSIFCPPATGRTRSLIRFGIHAGLTDAQIEQFLRVCKSRRDEFAPETWSGSRFLPTPHGSLHGNAA
ncbi:CAI-1 autoinducer synthase [Luteibacter sp. Sphag1AF]|uniref:alpha-hydroxyketone-type quorum-sensing autoinducer synthase n=1 Tax=Luteibacter sp. Sphag1AF TaxID=2587031 RepID=UPI0016136859|nr:alpha-hydroxyketone-type quorum-sensing autoinducer synthase [Luteibacter sp. Sphag1AF]MBB3228041.1 CAI-1 autoinducer synthase [Luteibacter sp. Sphag1AF]